MSSARVLKVISAFSLIRAGFLLSMALVAFAIVFSLLWVSRRSLAFSCEWGIRVITMIKVIRVIRVISVVRAIRVIRVIWVIRVISVIKGG